MHRNRLTSFPVVMGTALLFAACDDPTAPVANDQELITDVTITLTPVGGGTAITSTISDPDGPGPSSPNAQTGSILLVPGVTYDAMVEFFDRADPSAPEDITAEVAAEAEEHRVFHTVAGVTGVTIPANSLDEDANGAPLGLTFQVVVASGADGSGTLRIVLSHYDDQPKGDGSVQSDETDADVTFAVSID